MQVGEEITRRGLSSGGPSVAGSSLGGWAGRCVAPGYRKMAWFTRSLPLTPLDCSAPHCTGLSHTLCPSSSIHHLIILVLLSSFFVPWFPCSSEFSPFLIALSLVPHIILYPLIIILSFYFPYSFNVSSFSIFFFLSLPLYNYAIYPLSSSYRFFLNLIPVNPPPLRSSVSPVYFLPLLPSLPLSSLPLTPAPHHDRHQCCPGH